MRAILIAAALAAAQSQHSQKLPVPKWQVDRWEMGCVASLFAPGEKHARLEVFTAPGNDQFRISIMDPTWSASTFGKDPQAVEAVLKPGAISIRGGYFSKGVLEHVEKLHFGGSSYDHLDPLAQVRSLSVRDGGRELLQIPLPAAGRMVAALRGCENQYLQEWGIDVVAWRSLRHRPKPIKSLKTLISFDDYPEIPRREGAEGLSIARLDVGLDGKVKSCRIVAKALYRVLDERTCSVMKQRARFEPAQDASGKAVVAPYVVSILWIRDLPQLEEPPK